MATSTYTPPTIGPQGLTIPNYQQILNYLLESFKAIYGQNVYLGNDSADYQFISIIALALSDGFNSLQLDYNNRSPVFAIGAALDTLVKLNGLARKVATASTCQVVITGTQNTVINNGIVQDVNGNQWALPAVVTIPVGGSVTVTATCTQLGSINALIGDINVIATPTAGWSSVVNTVAAVLGQPVETDSQLRTRQALSTELPSITMLAGTIAAIAATPGVTRYNVLENPTSAVDANGNPPHSVTAVVEGGTDLDVATAIFNNRGIGCDTNGTTTVNITDPHTGVVQAISFMRPTYVPIYVSLSVHPLAGFSSATQDAINNALIAYLNSLQIGELLTISGLYAAAMQQAGNLSLPTFSIRALTAGTSPGPVGTIDITMLFNQVSQGINGNVVITLV